MSDNQAEKDAIEFIKKAYDGLSKELAPDFRYSDTDPGDAGIEALAPILAEYRGRLRIADMAALTGSAFYAVRNDMKLFSEVKPESVGGAEIASVINVFLMELVNWYNEYDDEYGPPDEVSRSVHLGEVSEAAYPPEK